MTDDEIRIAIANACGLEVCDNPRGPADESKWNKVYFTPSARELRRKRWPGSAVVKALPDYLNDLNACHEFEKTLTNDECAVYLMCLAEQLPLAGVNSWAFKATARQRAEAFCRAKGIWK